MMGILLKPSEDVNTGFQVSKMEPIYINLVSHLWLSLCMYVSPLTQLNSKHGFKGNYHVNYKRFPKPNFLANILYFLVRSLNRDAKT